MHGECTGARPKVIVGCRDVHLRMGCKFKKQVRKEERKEKDEGEKRENVCVCVSVSVSVCVCVCVCVSGFV